MPTYVSIPHILNGQPVDAANAGRPDRALEANLNYLRSQLSAITEGSALFVRNVLVESAVKVGMPVYFNSSTATFDRALAGAETDPVTGTLRPKASSLPVGVVYKKISATKADILIAGCASLSLTDAVVGTVSDGLYFLSAQTAGYLTKEQPYATVPVLQVSGSLVFLQIDLRDFLESHVHYDIALACQPSGETAVVAPGGRHSITNPTLEFPGWLPANHEIFEDKAPMGAAFGYNLTADEPLNRLWPPVPLEAVSFTWDKGRDLVGGTDIPQGLDGLVVANTDGIWWMSDCYDDVPWPNQNFTLEELSSSVPETTSQSSTQECGRAEVMRLILSFAKARFPNSKTAVTQLSADAGQPFEIVDQDGNPATTGCLKLRLNLSLLVDKTTEDTSARVIKDYNGTKFVTGNMVRRVKSSSSRLTVSGTVDPLDATKFYGDITLALSESGQETLIQADVMHVDAAKTRYEEEVPYIGLLPSVTASIRYQFQVPFAGLPTSPKFKVRFWFLGSSTGTLPTMTATYRRVTRPDGTTPQALPTVDSALTVTTNVAITSDSYLEVESSEYTVSAGDQVLVTLNRTTGDGYSGEVGVLLAALVVVAGS